MRPPEILQERGTQIEAISSAAVWRRAAVASVAAILLLALVVSFAQRQNRRHRGTLLLREGSYAVALEREFLVRELQAVQSDLRFLAQQPLLEHFLTGDAAARPALEQEYASFARSKPLYDQIRFLDESGQEVIRVNRRGDEVEVVDASQLQSKAARYYYREASALAVGEIYVSPFDLNVERGEIERPPKPVIRLATPVVDRRGQGRGLVVLNYAGSVLLGKLGEIARASRGDMMLVNTQGEYLQAPAPNPEWGWPLGHSESFRVDHPAAWGRIRDKDQAQVQIGDDLFTSERVLPTAGAASKESAIVVISRVSMSRAIDLRPGAGAVVLLIATVAGIVAVAFYWARVTVAHRTQEQRIAESEARLRALSSRLLAAQEEERRSLSRMLHDELGQSVTAIALNLKSALRHCSDEETEPLLRRAVEDTDGVLSSLHEIATRVRPSVLDDLGLEDAFESYVSEFEERTGVSVETELHLPSEGIPGTVGENLYRILQEALSNVSAHAGTDAAHVRLVAKGGGIELTIEDEGRGFDPATLKGSSRLGILGMRERVELLRGRFILRTAPGRGTKILIRLSLSGE